MGKYSVTFQQALSQNDAGETELTLTDGVKTLCLEYNSEQSVEKTATEIFQKLQQAETLCRALSDGGCKLLRVPLSLEKSYQNEATKNIQRFFKQSLNHQTNSDLLATLLYNQIKRGPDSKIFDNSKIAKNSDHHALLTDYNSSMTHCLKQGHYQSVQLMYYAGADFKTSKGKYQSLTQRIQQHIDVLISSTDNQETIKNLTAIDELLACQRNWGYLRSHPDQTNIAPLVAEYIDGKLSTNSNNPALWRALALVYCYHPPLPKHSNNPHCQLLEIVKNYYTAQQNTTTTTTSTGNTAPVALTRSRLQWADVDIGKKFSDFDLLSTESLPPGLTELNNQQTQPTHRNFVIKHFDRKAIDQKRKDHQNLEEQTFEL